MPLSEALIASFEPTLGTLWHKLPLPTLNQTICVASHLLFSGLPFYPLPDVVEVDIMLFVYLLRKV